MKLLLFKRRGKKKKKLPSGDNTGIFMLLDHKLLIVMDIQKKEALLGGDHSIYTTNLLLPKGKEDRLSQEGFYKVWYFRRNICTEQLLVSCIKSSISEFKNNKVWIQSNYFFIEKRLLGLWLQSLGMETQVGLLIEEAQRTWWNCKSPVWKKHLTFGWEHILG